MQDFILTLVVFFILFKVISSFRASRPVDDLRQEPPRDIYNDHGTRVEYRDKKNGGDDDFADYEIIDEDPKKDNP
jgi:hypothetical protein